jgi:hypothetical protein
MHIGKYLKTPAFIVDDNMCYRDMNDIIDTMYVLYTFQDRYAHG